MNATMKLLLVEDNPGDADLLREMLPETGTVQFEIDCVSRLSDALAYLKENEIELVLLDLGLPDSSGITSVRTLKKEFPDTPIVVLTGMEDETIGIASVQVGAQDYLVKGKTPAYHLSRVLRYAVERSRAEKRLRESGQFLRATLDALTAHIAIVDENGVILAVNNAWRKFAIRNGAQIENTCEGANYLATCDIVDAEDAAQAVGFATGIRQVLAGGSDCFEMEYPCHSPEKKRWFHGRVTPFPGKASQGVVVAHENITLQKQAEKALLASENKFRSIVDHIGIGVLLIGADMQVIEINQQIQNWFPDVPKTAPFLCQDFFQAACGDHSCDDCPTKRTLRDGLVHRSVHHNTATKQGRSYRISAFPLRDEAGDIAAVIQTIEDITEALSFEKKLRQAQKMESLGTLAGGIAHDFNNILSSIMGFTELALDKVPPDTLLQDNLQEVYLAGIRATQLVRQILTFSRQTEAEYYPLRIDLIVKEALKLLRSTLPTTIEIQLSIHKPMDFVLADPTQIHQIVMNLCTNASHAMEPKGGVLSIGLEQVTLDQQLADSQLDLLSGAYILLTVSDTGCGMTPEIMESIFDPYFTTKDLGEGTGLGLSLVHGIVKGCGGDISVASRPGEGTCFRIYFPSVKEASHPDRSPREAPLPRGTEKILVIDDEPPILKIMKRSLEQLGYQVTTENDSTKALTLIQSSPKLFDLIVSDMTMPKLTGDRLATAVKAISPALPFILWTGYSKSMSENKAVELGISALLTKPVSQVTLAREIRRVLDETKKTGEAANKAAPPA
jgi:signal transduction histidine kinase/DNA-binding response OmpR family regulator